MHGAPCLQTQLPVVYLSVAQLPIHKLPFFSAQVNCSQSVNAWISFAHVQHFRRCGAAVMLSQVVRFKRFSWRHAGRRM
jgi:hypothetical protein